MIFERDNTCVAKFSHYFSIQIENFIDKQEFMDCWSCRAQGDNARERTCLGALGLVDRIWKIIARTRSGTYLSGNAASGRPLKDRPLELALPKLLDLADHCGTTLGNTRSD